MQIVVTGGVEYSDKCQELMKNQIFFVIRGETKKGDFDVMGFNGFDD